MELSERKKAILKAVVEDYIDSAEPVSSKAISQRTDLNLSSATIRNEMSDLEDMGYLEQPHTSAGRIPTPQGYRVYVNELMRMYSVTLEESRLINANMEKRMKELSKVLSEAGKLTSQLTRYPSYTLQPAQPDIIIIRFELIRVDEKTFIIVVLLSDKEVKNRLITLPTAIPPEMLIKLATMFNASFTGKTESQITTGLIYATERASGDNIGLVAVIAGFVIEILSETTLRQPYVSGATNLLQYPEYKDTERAQRVLNYLADEGELLKLPGTDGGDGIKIFIGPENVAEELKDSSVVVVSYDAGDNMHGLIGVVGPTRMDYSKVAAKLSMIAAGLGRAFSSGSLSPNIETHSIKGVELNEQTKEKE